MTHALHIDFYLDLVCPWCLIGKRQLDRAVAEFTNVPGNPAVQVHWRSVQLFPDLPVEGLDFEAFYRQRLGSIDAVHARQAQVRAAARRAGTEVHFERIRRFPNTRLAHQMLAYGTEKLSPEMLNALLDALLEGYFQQGADLGDEDSLLAIGSRHEIDPAAWRAWLDHEHRFPEQNRVSSVPLLVFNRQISLRGAQPQGVLLEAMGEACEAAAASTI
ncbi:DsbA family oxidoreductase [Variovorax sp. J22P240]|nr:MULTISPECIES: DsbA family oxidoreductase [unclassified Variovorax]MDM0000623.1 DsbA family oxidoreductase [Variovorax sp. J22P240]MDM0052893.1 DsbA family oxidoreductase [Variovorax sp. J22R115]